MEHPFAQNECISRECSGVSRRHHRPFCRSQLWRWTGFLFIALPQRFAKSVHYVLFLPVSVQLIIQGKAGVSCLTLC